MEQTPPWPTSVFSEDPSKIAEGETGLNKTNNGKFIVTVKKWREEAEYIMMDIETEMENVLFDFLSAREFLTAQTFTEARAAELKVAYVSHSKWMLGIMKQDNSTKLKDFMKDYPLSENAKGYVKDEFRKFNNHIMSIQKHVNNDLAGIMKDWEEAKKKEDKPTPAIQPLGTET